MRNAPEITIEQICDLFQCSLVSPNKLSNEMFFSVDSDAVGSRRFNLVHKGMRLWIHVWSGEECASYLQGEDVWDSSFDVDCDYFVVDFSYKEACIWSSKTFEIRDGVRRSFMNDITDDLASYIRGFQDASAELLKQLTSITSNRKESIVKIIEFATDLGYQYDEKALKLRHNDRDWPTIYLEGKNSVIVRSGGVSYHFDFNELSKIQKCVLHQLESMILDKNNATKIMTEAIEVLSQSIENGDERCKT